MKYGMECNRCGETVAFANIRTHDCIGDGWDLRTDQDGNVQVATVTCGRTTHDTTCRHIRH